MASGVSGRNKLETLLFCEVAGLLDDCVFRFVRFKRYGYSYGYISTIIGKG